MDRIIGGRGSGRTFYSLTEAVNQARLGKRVVYMVLHGADVMWLLDMEPIARWLDATGTLIANESKIIDTSGGYVMFVAMRSTLPTMSRSAEPDRLRGKELVKIRDNRYMESWFDRIKELQAELDLEKRAYNVAMQDFWDEWNGERLRLAMEREIAARELKGVQTDEA